jgi:hypothetical protein
MGATMIPTSGSMQESQLREPIEVKVLETAIANAVKTFAPNCKPFIGVIVEQSAPSSPDDTNWTVKGIKFGTAEREACSAALSVVVTRLKREFEIAHRSFGK